MSAFVFLDKNGNEIKEGTVVKFTSEETIGERSVRRGRGRERDVFSVKGDVEIIGVVRLGIFQKHSRDEGIYTYWIETGQEISYMTHFYQANNRDPLTSYTKNLSRILTPQLSAKCEIYTVEAQDTVPLSGLT